MNYNYAKPASPRGTSVEETDGGVSAWVTSSSEPVEVMPERSRTVAHGATGEAVVAPSLGGTASCAALCTLVEPHHRRGELLSCPCANGRRARREAHRLRRAGKPIGPALLIRSQPQVVDPGGWIRVGRPPELRVQLRNVTRFTSHVILIILEYVKPVCAEYEEEDLRHVEADDEAEDAIDRHQLTRVLDAARTGRERRDVALRTGGRRRKCKVSCMDGPSWSMQSGWADTTFTDTVHFKFDSTRGYPGEGPAPGGPDEKEPADEAVADALKTLAQAEMTLADARVLLQSAEAFKARAESELAAALARAAPKLAHPNLPSCGAYPPPCEYPKLLPPDARPHHYPLEAQRPASEFAHAAHWDRAERATSNLCMRVCTNKHCPACKLWRRATSGAGEYYPLSYLALGLPRAPFPLWRPTKYHHTFDCTCGYHGEGWRGFKFDSTLGYPGEGPKAGQSDRDRKKRKRRPPRLCDTCNKRHYGPCRPERIRGPVAPALKAPPRRSVHEGNWDRCPCGTVVDRDEVCPYCNDTGTRIGGPPQPQRRPPLPHARVADIPADEFAAHMLAAQADHARAQLEWDAFTLFRDNPKLVLDAAMEFHRVVLQARDSKDNLNFCELACNHRCGKGSFRHDYVPYDTNLDNSLYWVHLQYKTPKRFRENHSLCAYMADIQGGAPPVLDLEHWCPSCGRYTRAFSLCHVCRFPSLVRAALALSRRGARAERRRKRRDQRIIHMQQQNSCANGVRHKSPEECKEHLDELEAARARIATTVIAAVNEALARMPHADLRTEDHDSLCRIATIQACAQGVPADLALLGYPCTVDSLIVGALKNCIARDIERVHPAIEAACLNPLPDHYFGLAVHNEDATIFLRGLLGRPLGTEAEFNECHRDRYDRHLAASRLIPSTMIRSLHPPVLEIVRVPGAVPEYQAVEHVDDRTMRHTLLGRAGQAVKGAVSGLVEEGLKIVGSHGAIALAHTLLPALALHPLVALGGTVAAVIGAGFSILESERPLETAARAAGQLAFYATGSAAPVVHAGYNAAVALAGAPQAQLSVLSSRHVTSLIQDSVCLAHLPVPPTQEQFKVQEGVGDCFPTFGTRATCAFAPVTQTVYRKCKHNNRLAIASRIGLAHPGVKSKAARLAVADEWSKTHLALDEVVRRTERFHAMRFEQWLKRFPGPVKRIMRDLRRQGGPLPWKARYKCFLKLEKSAWLIGGGGKETVPRVISACLKELTYWTGRHLLPLAKACHRGWRKQRKGNIFYASGQTPEQIGQAFRDAIANIDVAPGDHIVFIEDDQNRFDLHLTRPAFEALEEFYERVKLPRHIRRMLRRGISRGRMSDGTKFSVPYTMQSGNPDTGVGDTIINAIMKIYIHGVGGNWSTIICGDDSVTVTTASALRALGGAEGLRQAYAKLGMETAVEVRTNPLAVEFCSGRFQPHFDTYILVPKTGKMITRAYWDIVDRSPANQRAWTRGVSLGLKNFGRHNPFYSALGNRALEVVGPGKVIRTLDPYSVFAPTYETQAKNLLPFDRPGFLAYHAYHYGYTSAECARLTAQLAQVQLFRFNDLPLVRRAARVDLCPRG